MSVTTLAPPESDRESHLAFDIRPFDDESSNFDQALLAGESESPGGAEVTAEVMPSETSADGDAEAWLHDALAVGGLIILAGGPSSGKGFVGCRLAAHVTKGEPGPFKLPYPAPSVPGDVLFITDRLTRRTLRKRLVAAGTDMDRVAPLPLAVHDSMDLKAIASELETRPDCKLLLIDPLPMTFGGTPAQMDDAYLLFRDLADLAARHRLALVAAVRLRQDRRDSKRDLDWLCGCGLGTVLALGRDRANSNRRFLLPARCVDDRDDLSIAFRVEEVPDAEAEAARVEWLVEPLATDTAKARAGMLRAQESRRDAAGVWLVEALSNGPVYVKELERLAECAGHAWSTVRLAKGELPIEIKTLVTDGVARSHWQLRAPSPSGGDARGNPPLQAEPLAQGGQLAQQRPLAHGVPEHAGNGPE